MQVKNITAEHVFLACGHTDMRKSIDGLAAIVYYFILYTSFHPPVFAAFARTLWFNKGILNAGEIGVSDNSLLEKLKVLMLL